MVFLSPLALASFRLLQEDYKKISYTQYLAYISQAMHIDLTTQIEDTIACRDALSQLYILFLNNNVFWKDLFPSLRECELYQAVSYLSPKESLIITFMSYHTSVPEGVKLFDFADALKRIPTSADVIDFKRRVAEIASHVAPKTAVHAYNVLRCISRDHPSHRIQRYQCMIKNSGHACYHMIQSVRILEHYNLISDEYYELFIQATEKEAEKVYDLLDTMEVLRLLQEGNYTQAMACKKKDALIDSLRFLNNMSYATETTQMYFNIFCRHPLSKPQLQIMQLLSKTSIFKDVTVPENALKLALVENNHDHILSLFNKLADTEVMKAHPQRMFNYVLERATEPSTHVYANLMFQIPSFLPEDALQLQKYQKLLCKLNIAEDVANKPECILFYLLFFIRTCENTPDFFMLQKLWESFVCDEMKELHKKRASDEVLRLSTREMSGEVSAEFSTLLNSYRSTSSLNPCLLLLPEEVRQANTLCAIKCGADEYARNRKRAIYLFYSAFAESSALNIAVKTVFPSLEAGSLYQATLLLRQHERLTKENFELLIASPNPFVVAQSIIMLPDMTDQFVCYRHDDRGLQEYTERPLRIAESFLALKTHELDTLDNINFMACHDDPSGVADTLILLKDGLLPMGVAQIIEHTLWSNPSSACVSQVIRIFQKTNVFTSEPDGAIENIRALLTLARSRSQRWKALCKMLSQLETAGLLLSPYAGVHLRHSIEEVEDPATDFLCRTVGAWPTPTFPEKLFQDLHTHRQALYIKHGASEIICYDEQEALNTLKAFLREIDQDAASEDSVDTINTDELFETSARLRSSLQELSFYSSPPEQTGVALGKICYSSSELGDEELLSYPHASDDEEEDEVRSIHSLKK